MKPKTMDFYLIKSRGGLRRWTDSLEEVRNLDGHSEVMGIVGTKEMADDWQNMIWCTEGEGSMAMVIAYEYALAPIAVLELSGGSGIGNTSGGGSMKESMAKVIAYEYALAPIVLSMTVTGAVLMASYMASRAEAQATEAEILG